MFCMHTLWYIFLPPSQLLWNQQKGINHFWPLQLAFQFVGHKCQGGPWCGCIQKESAWGKKEAGTGDLGATVWRSVTNTGPSPVNTRSHTVTETHRREQGGVCAVAASAAPARLPLSLLHCLLVVQNTDREESKISHFSLNFQIAKIYMEILYACKSFKCDLGWKISLLIQ